MLVTLLDALSVLLEFISLGNEMTCHVLVGGARSLHA